MSAPSENHLKTGGEQATFANKSLAGSVDPECEKVFQLLKIRRKHRFLVYRIDPDTEAVIPEIIGPREATLKDLKVALPENDSRYAIYDHEFTTYDGRPTNKLYFISWFPPNATPYSKMAYTQAKSHVREVFTGVLDLLCRTPAEVESMVTGEPEEEEDQEFGDDDF
ncbi:hypothetical protein CTAYLR_009178 [Chrysophaeum taylorii]|uniref:ADF-H domain-containing protein n=1 Tax=Chrysophaeum taylorii TaxID=2483200 RepID=A0AAD7XNW7_9STRA|nr:hypothetical protein CTAYLR_009178 [Chrysophaeum taylorii]